MQGTTERLKKQWEFQQALAQGRKARSGPLTLYARHRPGQPLTRLGIVVTKQHAPSAVERNRWKRIIREVFRKHKAHLKSAHDIVVMLRRGENTVSYSTIEKHFLTASGKAALLA